MNKKIIKSFSELSDLNPRELFQKKNTKKGYDLILKPMNKRVAISIARQLSDGFNQDLRKQPTKSDYRKAQKVIKAYFENVKYKNARIIRPSKKNRAIYAQAADLPKNFKVYPIHMDNPNNKLKIVKKNGKRKLKQIGEFISYDYYYFPDRIELVKNAEKETLKLQKQIDKNKKEKDINIIVGSHIANKIIINEDSLIDTILLFQSKYDNFGDFVRGFRVSTYKNQVKKKAIKNVKKRIKTKNKIK